MSTPWCQLRHQEAPSWKGYMNGWDFAEIDLCGDIEDDLRHLFLGPVGEDCQPQAGVGLYGQPEPKHLGEPRHCCVGYLHEKCVLAHRLDHDRLVGRSGTVYRRPTPRCALVVGDVGSESRLHPFIDEAIGPVNELFQCPNSLKLHTETSDRAGSVVPSRDRMEKRPSTRGPTGGLR